MKKKRKKNRNKRRKRRMQKKKANDSHGLNITNDCEGIIAFCLTECLASELSTMEEGKLKTYYSYIDNRMKEIHMSDGPHAARAFRFASAMFLEHGHIHSILREVLLNVGNENIKDRFMKSIKFRVMYEEQTSELYCITDVKTLLFFMAGVILHETGRQYPCPLEGEDYEIMFNEDQLRFAIILGKSWNQENLHILSDPIMDNTDDELNHLTMDDLISENTNNQNFVLVNKYFDEIFEYTMMNELFTSEDDQDEE